MAYFPIPNLNGQTRENLIDENLEAMRAITDAIRLAGLASPHGRDFQLNPQDLNEARARHLERVRKLEEVRKEFYDIAMHLVAGE